MEISPAVSSVNLSSINSIRSKDDPGYDQYEQALINAFTKDLNGNDISFNDDWNAALNNPTPANIKKLHDDINAIEKAFKDLEAHDGKNSDVYVEFCTEMPGPFFKLMSDAPQMSDKQLIQAANDLAGNIKPISLPACVTTFLQCIQ